MNIRLFMFVILVWFLAQVKHPEKYATYDDNGQNDKWKMKGDINIWIKKWNLEMASQKTKTNACENWRQFGVV